MKVNTICMSPPKSLKQFNREAGVSHVTSWRWRKLGWLETVNICGKQYVTAEAIAKFQERAESGEFAKNPVVPAPPRRA